MALVKRTHKPACLQKTLGSLPPGERRMGIQATPPVRPSPAKPRLVRETSKLAHVIASSRFFARFVHGFLLVKPGTQGNHDPTEIAHKIVGHLIGIPQQDGSTLPGQCRPTFPPDTRNPNPLARRAPRTRMAPTSDERSA